MATKKDILKQQIAVLEKGAAEEQIKVLNKIKKTGSTEVIEPMIDLFVKTENLNVASLIIDVLSQLKDSASANVIAASLKNVTDHEKKAQILNSMWNSSLDYSDLVSPVVKNGVVDDFMVTFEVVTIIENLKGPFNEEDLLDASLFISSLPIEDYQESVQPFIVQLQQMINNYLQTV